MTEADHLSEDCAKIGLEGLKDPFHGLFHLNVSERALRVLQHKVKGILLFAGIGDISRLNCDLLIMEEDMGTEDRIALIHDSGKQAIVWTVNTEDSMHKFLDSSCDAVITDQVELAEKVQVELDQRSDFQIIRDKFSNLFDD